MPGVIVEMDISDVKGEIIGRLQLGMEFFNLTKQPSYEVSSIRNGSLDTKCSHQCIYTYKILQPAII